MCESLYCRRRCWPLIHSKLTQRLHFLLYFLLFHCIAAPLRQRSYTQLDRLRFVGVRAHSALVTGLTVQLLIAICAY